MPHNPRDMQDADKEDAVVLAITRDGKISSATHQTPLDQITAKVKDASPTSWIRRFTSRATPARSTAMWSRWWTMSGRQGWTPWACSPSG